MNYPNTYSLTEIPTTDTGAGWLAHNVQWGGMNLAYYPRIPAGFDSRPYFRGLPAGLCQIGHWGYVMEGELVVTYPDREEAVRAGQVFYSPPGHSVRHTETTRMLELSPLHEWNSTMSAWRANATLGQ